MRPFAPVSLLPLLSLALALACSDGTNPTDASRPAFDAGGQSGFSLNGDVSGFPTGAVRLTGGGSFDLSTASNTVPTEAAAASTSGSFSCTEPVGQGPLTGCAKDQGVRWDTVQLLASTGFKCTGSDALKPATTDAHTAVLLADFYRAGDGNIESFTAQIIVADRDIAPDIPGVQNLWVQGVGCGTASVHLH
jgi:hypothetical protein